MSTRRKKTRREKNSFFGHIDELRKVLIKVACTLLCGCIASFLFHKEILFWLTKPINSQLVLLSPFEGFLTACKIAFISGLILTSPLWIYFTLCFVLPALHKRERTLIAPILFLSFLFVLGGTSFGYYVTLPLSLHFLEKFSLGINLWALTKTVSFILSLLFAHALAFELVVIALFLAHIGLLSHSMLSRARRFVYVALLIASAILTPPDVVSQLLLALPLALLFECIVLYASFRKRRAKRLNTL